MKEKKKLSLPAWIFIGMLAGIVAGLIFAFAGLGDFTTEWIKPVGTIYVNLLKFLVVPVVLFSIADGVISLKDLKRVGSVGVKTFIYYMITTALAVVIGLILVNIFKGNFTPLPSADLGALEYEAKEAPSVMQVIVNIFPDNFFKPMVNSDMLPVIVIAIFLGAGVLAAGEQGQKIGDLIHCCEEVIMKIMMMIIKFTPIGVFCLMTNVVAVNGADIIGKLALIIGVAYLGYIVHVVVVYGLSVKFLSKMSPIKFFKGLAPAMITAFTTTSSNATLPVNIECCNKMGAEPEISSFVLPLGATINMDDVADIGNTDDERQLADDVRTVDSDDVGHQAEDTDRGELDDHHHDLHDDFFHAVDKLCDLLALLTGGQDARAEEDGDDDDRQHVGGDHRLQQVGREDVHDDLHNGRSFLGFIFQSAQICGRQRGEAALEEVDEHEADDDGQRGRAHIVHKRLDADGADALEVLQADDAVSNREQDDRDDQELQQVDVDRADGLDPLRGKIAETGKRKNETGDDTGQHADEYPRRQAKFFLFFHTFLLLSKITDKDQ